MFRTYKRYLYTMYTDKRIKGTTNVDKMIIATFIPAGPVKSLFHIIYKLVLYITM